MIILKSRCLEAHVLPYGASLSGLWFQKRSGSLVLGSQDANAYKAALNYSGAIVGPVANRIGGGVVQIDGKPWHMDANEGQTSLHSGPHGLHARLWEVIDRSDSYAVLRCDLPAGACGLPGQRRFEARYSVNDEGELHLNLTATTDSNTLVNLAHHPYWRLGSDLTVADHKLEVMADHYLPVDANTLPTGEVAHVQGTAYDFRTPRFIPVDQTLDANYCLAHSQRSDPQTAAKLTAPDGLTLQIDTTESGLQIYNATGLTPAPIRLHKGQVLTSVPDRIIAIECSPCLSARLSKKRSTEGFGDATS